MLMRISFVLAIVLSPVAAMAQALANRLPVDTIAYVGWSGPEAQAKAYEGSHLKAILENSQIRETITQFLPKLFEETTKNEPDAAAQFAAVMEVFDTGFVAYKHPFAYAFTGISLEDPDHPMPRFVFVCDAGDDVETVYKTVKKQFNGPTTKPLADAGYPIRVARADTLVIGTIGYDQAKDALVGGKGAGAKSLATAPKFKAALATAGKQPAVVVYANVDELVKLIDSGVKKVNDPQAIDMWPKIRDALGLGGMKGLLYAAGFDGKDWGETLFVDAPAPRKGLLSLLEARPLSNDILKAIPQDATSAGVSNFDPAKLISAAREAMNEINPNAAQQVDQMLDAVDQQIGMSLEKDVLGSLGAEWGYYASPSVGGEGLLATVVVNQLRDPAKFEQAIDKLQTMGNSLLEQNDSPPMKFRLKETKVGEMKIRYLGMPFFTPAWAIQGGRLYIGMFPQNVASAVAAANKAGAKSILDNPKFTALRDRLGAVNPTGFIFADLRATAPTNYSMWQAVSRLAGMGDMMGVDSPPMILPPLNVVMEHLAPAGSATWSDDAGFHMRSISPFPGSEALASDPIAQLMMSQGFGAFTYLVPSLAPAREQANRVKSASNLRQLGLAAQIHANENKGKLPNSLHELLKQEVTPELFVNPRSNTAVPRGLEGEALEKWVDESSDYVYLGAGKDYTAPADEVMAYEKPDGLSEGINLLFYDGHVEFVPTNRAMVLIEKSKQKKPAVKPKPAQKKPAPPADGGL